ncbi:MAG: hypothetical protein FJ139_09395 [Deltaproteobacteria bacterium]|nr:hypothetical protein [Deltaproteobacteria bacterium]
MITINSYIHRSVLYDIIRRWMYCEVYPSDVDLITRIVHFNNVYVFRYLKILADRLFGEVHRCEFSARPAFIKGDLKDIIIVNPPYFNARVNELINHYRHDPGRFYRETPFHAMLYFKRDHPADIYIGSSRIKRVHRLAEKAARRIIDQMYDAIKKHADSLAEERAKRLGIERYQLVTPAEEMIEEFLRAEDRFIDDLKHKRSVQDNEGLVINDVAGIKVIVEDSQQDGLIALLERMNCRIIEEERHAGKYNATNLIVSFAPPKEKILSQPLGEKIVTIMEKRGMSPGQSNRDFAEFVDSGEESVYVEIIVSNYQEMLESEIGRCIHEDRIIEQRLRQEYCGSLAKNVEYLMEYLFTFPSSSRIEIGDLPIKIWNRYLPDYFEQVLWELFRIPRYNVLDE